MIHYTDKSGYNMIKSQIIWFFKAAQPRAKHNPVGAYFTKYQPEEPDLAAKIRVSRDKLKFMFEFKDIGDLISLPGGRGKYDRLFYSRFNYSVEPERQIKSGETGL